MDVVSPSKFERFASYFRYTGLVVQLGIRWGRGSLWGIDAKLSYYKRVMFMFFSKFKIAGYAS
jgi:hypothetical protein